MKKRGKDAQLRVHRNWLGIRAGTHSCASGDAG